ncbi:MAG: amidohydrolase [Woeseiaceae bacterium]
MMKHLRRLMLPALIITLIGCTSGEDDVADAPKTSVDTLITNANGYTLRNGELIRFSTMTIRDGKIVATGDESLAGAYTADTTIDAKGQTILPGLIDAHGHVSSLGALRSRVDLAGIATLDSTLSRIAAFDRELDEGAQWLLGRGWNQVLWTGKQFPTASDLDDIVGNDRAVFLNRVDGHAAWANSKALELAGINSETPDPAGGKILRDENGAATGVLIDAAMGLVFDVIPMPPRDEQKMHIEIALQELASLGITGVHDAGSTLTELSLYEELADEDKMAIRVSAMLGGMETLAEVDAPVENYANDIYQATSVKLYADGALGSRGAAMIEDYSDDPGNQGLLFANETGLAEMIQAAHDKGFAAHVHAIGDRANQAALSAFAMVNNDAPSAFNDRVEHAQIVALEDIKRFATLDIIASIQPTHATSDMNMAEDRVGSERILGAYAWRRMLDAGVRLAGGSDFPVEKPDMYDGLYSAVARKDKQGNPVEGWFPDQALTREQALALFTTWAAESVGQGDIIGELSEGMHADFIMLDRDYFEIPEIEIWQMKTRQTWVAGEPVFTAE